MNYGGLFDVDSKLSEIKKLESEVNSVSFWNNNDRAQSVINRLNVLRSKTSSIVSLRSDIVDALELISLLEESFDEEVYSFVLDVVSSCDSKVSALELELLLSGPYDSNNAIVEIHSGAGGTEACDWALMLYRMYSRWCEKKGYSVTVFDLLDGDEAGIKRVSFLVKGVNAYGFLRGEKGIHRLVRLSPFDSNNKRHTSFASVEVMPEFDNEVDVDIRDEDLKIDVYRSSGAGGQGVNTTDSAVRITHLPTKTVVTCQNERSQLKNKEKALSILKGKLLLLEIEAKEKELASIRGDSMNIDFGSQIRSYVMHPYSMVKDHRTGVSTSDVSGVLDGDIDMFIEAYLRS